MSSACTQLNDRAYDSPTASAGSISAFEELGLEFNAGEHITARTAGIGETPGGDANTVFHLTLFAAPPEVSLGVVDSASSRTSPRQLVGTDPDPDGEPDEALMP